MLADSLKDVPTVAAVLSHDPEAVRAGKLDRGELTLEIEPARIVATCRFLKDVLSFVRLSDVTAVDRLPREPRFEVIYHLHAMDRHERLRLKCRLDGGAAEIESVTSVWRSADWYEREVFDLFGIAFRNHPNLTRIMMPEDWEGHPLRKDYPVYGERYKYKEPA